MARALFEHMPGKAPVIDDHLPGGNNAETQAPEVAEPRIDATLGRPLSEDETFQHAAAKAALVLHEDWEQHVSTTPHTD